MCSYVGIPISVDREEIRYHIRIQDREGFWSMNHVVDLLNEVRRFGPRKAFFSCKNTKQIMICFVPLQLKKAILGPKRLASLNKSTM